MLKLLFVAGPWGMWNLLRVSNWFFPFEQNRRKRHALAIALLTQIGADHARNRGPFNGWVTKGVYLEKALSEAAAHLGAGSVGERIDVARVLKGLGYRTRW